MIYKLRLCYRLFVLSFLLFGVLILSNQASAGTIIRGAAYLGLTNGIVGCWNFDGNYTKAQDCSGNNNVGVLSGGPSKVIGKTGQALNFDGVDDAVKTQNTFNANSSIITVSFWLKWNRNSNDGKLVMELSSNANNNDDTFLISPNNDTTPDTFVVSVQNGSSKYRSETIPQPSTGVWHHYGIIMDNSTVTGDVRIFLDGVEQSTSIEANTKLGSGNFRIDNLNFMARDASSFFGAGTLDDVRIYNRALSVNEIVRLYRIGLGSNVNRSNITSLSNGLVGCWNFDGNYTRVPDCSGNGNTGLATGPVKVIGKVGQALRFDGLHDDVVFDRSAISDFTRPATVCAWINTRDINSDQTIVTNYQDDNNFFVFHMNSGGNLDFTYKSGAVIYDDEAAGVISPNVWTYVCASWNGTSNSLYKNGSSLAIGDYSDSSTNGNLIGNRILADDRNMNGLIDEVRIYNRALSASEIRNLYQESQSKLDSSKTDNLINGLVGYWTFDGSDISGTRAKDVSGKNNHGDITGATKAIGKIGQALSFDGNDIIDLPESSNLSPGSGTFAVSAWVKTNNYCGGASADCLIYSNYGTSSTAVVNVAINGSTGKLLGTYRDTGGDEVEVVAGPVVDGDGRWHHVVSVRETTTSMRLYVDGVSVGTATNVSLGDIDVTTAFNPTIGDISDGGGEPFYGLIDEVRIYNRALSASEVNKLYQIGK